MDWAQALSIILPSLGAGAAGTIGSYWIRQDSKARRVADGQRAREQRNDARADRRRDAYWGILNIAEPYMAALEFSGVSIAMTNDLLRTIPSHLNNVRLFGKRETHAPAMAMVDAAIARDLAAYKVAREDFIAKAFEDVDPFGA